MISKVRLNRCLKAGRTVWNAGTVFTHPGIPALILLEARRKTGRVDVLEHLPDPVKVVEKKPEAPLDVSTSITNTVKTSNKTTNNVVKEIKTKTPLKKSSKKKATVQKPKVQVPKMKKAEDAPKTKLIKRKVKND